MQKSIIGNWEIEFDKEATQKAYAQMSTAKYDCGCLSCRNFNEAAPLFPAPVVDFFTNLGADVIKPAEVYDCGEFTEDHLLYYGLYHIVGNYLSGVDVWQPVAKKRLFRRRLQKDYQHYVANTETMHAITSGFEIGFTENLSMLADGFPTPALQMEIKFCVPWILDEPFNQNF